MDVIKQASNKKASDSESRRPRFQNKRQRKQIGGIRQNRYTEQTLHAENKTSMAKEKLRAKQVITSMKPSQAPSANAKLFAVSSKIKPKHP